jgi:hypothetical protein
MAQPPTGLCFHAEPSAARACVLRRSHSRDVDRALEVDRTSSVVIDDNLRRVSAFDFVER